MKIDRLIGIITILLQNEKVTVPELAERFEVSRRTINRDIEDICRAGIPIATMQGANGGISIMESYKIEKTLFSEEEMRAIFVGLSSLDSVAQNRKYKNIMDKFAGHRYSGVLQNNVLINLSSHYKETLAPKIQLLQTSIENRQQVSFTYYNQKGEHQITINPYLVVFQWSNWYLFGADGTTKQFKLYKLNRISDLQPIECSFEWQEISEKELDFNQFFTDEIQAVVIFEQSEKYRLIDEYGVESFKQMPDGKLCFSFPFTNLNYLKSWVLSFGEKAELIEPKGLRTTIKEELEMSLKKYLE